MSEPAKDCALLELKYGKDYAEAKCGIEKKCERCGWRESVRAERRERIAHGRGLRENGKGLFCLRVDKPYYKEE